MACHAGPILAQIRRSSRYWQAELEDANGAILAPGIRIRFLFALPAASLRKSSAVQPSKGKGQVSGYLKMNYNADAEAIILFPPAIDQRGNEVGLENAIGQMFLEVNIKSAAGAQGKMCPAY